MGDRLKNVCVREGRVPEDLIFSYFSQAISLLIADLRWRPTQEGIVQ